MKKTPLCLIFVLLTSTAMTAPCLDLHLSPGTYIGASKYGIVSLKLFAKTGWTYDGVLWIREDRAGHFKTMRPSEGHPDVITGYNPTKTRRLTIVVSKPEKIDGVILLKDNGELIEIGELIRTPEN